MTNPNENPATGTGQPAGSQPQAMNDNDALKKSLTYEKEILTLRKEILTAQKDALIAEKDSLQNAKLSAYTGALKGDATLENVDIEAHVMALQAVGEAAATVAKAVKEYRDYKDPKRPIKTLIIYNAEDATALRQYRVFDAFATSLLQAYAALLSEPDQDIGVDLAAAAGTGIGSAFVAPLMAAQGVGAIVESLVNLVSFFRTDIKIAGVNVKTEETALVAVFIKRLHEGMTQADSITVYYPALFPIENADSTKALSDLLSKMQSKRQEAQVKINSLTEIVNKNALERADLESQLAAATNDDQKAALRQQIAILDIQTAQHQQRFDGLNGANAAYDKLLAGLITPDESGALKGLLMLARAAALQTKFDAGAHWVHLQVHKSGGNIMTKKNNLFTEPKLLYTGGATLSYMVVDKDMTVVLSGEAIGYLGYQQIEHIQESLNAD